MCHVRPADFHAPQLSGTANELGPKRHLWLVLSGAVFGRWREVVRGFCPIDFQRGAFAPLILRRMLCLSTQQSANRMQAKPWRERLEPQP